jgi:hypothetical protein
MEGINTEKIIGYLLLILGFAIIVYSSINVLNVFQGKSQPFNLFSFESISIDLSSLLAGQTLPPGAEVNQMLVDKDLLNQPMNIMAHIMLMGFIASAGFKIAKIGVMLIRPIKVNLLRKADVEVKKQ